MVSDRSLSLYLKYVRKRRTEKNDVEEVRLIVEVEAGVKIRRGVEGHANPHQVIFKIWSGVVDASDIDMGVSLLVDLLFSALMSITI